MGEKQERLFEVSEVVWDEDTGDFYKIVHVKEHWRKVKVKNDQSRLP